MCPSSRRGGSLGKSGIGITRSFSSGTPKSASVRKPRCEWTTIRSNRENSLRHIFVLRTDRRGSRSCAVNTFGPRARKSRSSIGGAANHWTCRTSRGFASRRAIPNGCSTAFTGIRSFERRKTREENG